MDFYLETNRLVIKPLNEAYFRDYFNEFSLMITQYQYPDSLENLAAAENCLSNFVDKMSQGEMLELVIVLKDEFIGSIEVFDINKATPTIGLWVKQSCHGLGYAYEALSGLLKYLNQMGQYEYFIYEADVRNSASIKLVEKFDVKKGPFEEIVTTSGKRLLLQTYHIF